MAVSVQTSSAAPLQGTVRVPPVPPKNSVVILGPFENKPTFVHSLYVALVKLSELDLLKTVGLLENNVIGGRSDEATYARLRLHHRRRKDEWIVAFPPKLSSAMLSDQMTAIKALRGELGDEAKEIVENHEIVEKIMSKAKKIVYIYDASDQLYAALELSNLISAIEGRKVERFAVVSFGRNGIPHFLRSSLEAVKEMGYIKNYRILEMNTMTSFEMLKLAKFLFL